MNPNSESMVLQNLDIIESVKKQLFDENGVMKAATINTTTGLYSYDMEAPAKLVIPSLTSWARTIPRGQAGAAAHEYAVIDSVGMTGKSTAVAGKRGGALDMHVTRRSLVYGTMSSGVFSVTEQGRAQAVGFDDSFARATTLRLLSALRNECAHIPWGNRYALPVPVCAASDNTAVTGVLNSAATYYVYVRPITGMALQKALLARVVANPSLQIIANVDYWTVDPSAISAGSPAVDLTDGYGAPSTVSSVATPGATTGIDIRLTTGSPGAAGYAIFVGTITGIANAALQCIVGPVKYVTLLNVSTGGTKASTTTAYTDGYGVPQTMNTTVDTSADLNDYLGLIPGLYGLTADLTITPSGCYLRSLGDALSPADGTGIPEIDEGLEAAYQRQLGVDDVEILVGGGMQRNINYAFGSGAATSIARVMIESGAAQADVTAGIFVTKYIHPITRRLIPITVDPNMWDGMLVVKPNTVPYANSDIDSVAKVWPVYDWREYTYNPTEPTQNYELQTYGAVANYIPVAWAIIDDIRRGF